MRKEQNNMSLLPKQNRKAEALKLENTELLLKCVLLEEELATLRARANAYDEGTVAWFVVDVEDHTAIAMSSESRAKAIEQAWLGLGMKGLHHCPGGYTCRKVRVCREVENEKGKE